MDRPVIFLDFDGVLNTEQYQATLAVEGKPAKDRWGMLFDPRAVNNLRRILDSTGSVIVVSSSWRRIYSLDRLRVMWSARELPGEIVDAIPCGSYYISRGEEINCWLDRNGRPDYVILDDVDEFMPGQRNRYIEINPIVGITASDANRAIELLNQ